MKRYFQDTVFQLTQLTLFMLRGAVGKAGMAGYLWTTAAKTGGLQIPNSRTVNTGEGGIKKNKIRKVRQTMRLFFILLTFAFGKVSAQSKGSFSICHTRDGHLNEVILGDYEIGFVNDRIDSLSYKKGLITYSDSKCQFDFNSSNRSPFSIKFLDTGVFVQAGIFTGTINTLSSIGLNDDKEKRDVAFFFDSVHMVSLSYENNQLRRMYISFEKCAVTLSLEYKFNDKPIWNTLIEAKNDESSFMYTFLNGLPELVSVRDKSLGNGVTIFYNFNGYIKRIQENTFFQDRFIPNKNAYINYNKRGVLRKNKMDAKNRCN